MTLRPTELVIFGNAKGGTPLMQSNQEIEIDLPLKALVYQDASGGTWISYNDPAWLAKRHGLGAEVEAPVKAMAAMLSAVTRRPPGIARAGCGKWKPVFPRDKHGAFAADRSRQRVTPEHDSTRFDHV